MTITTKNMHAQIKIKINNKEVKEITQSNDEKYFKFLGFRLDNNLSWKHHIEHVSNKLQTANYIMATVKNIFSEKIKKLIYYALAQSHIDYGLPIWYTSNKTKQLNTLQKKTAKKRYQCHIQCPYQPNISQIRNTKD